MTTIGALLDAVAEEHGGRAAVISAAGATTYRELQRQSNAVAKGLAALGVSRGTRVGLLMPNGAEWLACAFGALKLGALLVPLNTLWRQPELAYGLRYAEVAVLVGVTQFLKHDYAALLQAICPALGQRAAAELGAVELPALRQVVLRGAGRPAAATDFAEMMRRGAAVSDERLAKAQVQVVPSDESVVFFTSGTTAAPKGAVHTHASMLHTATHIADRLGLMPEDRTWGYLPFFFAGGFVAVALATLSRGGAVLVQDVFEAGTTLRLLAEHRCTTFFAWPHQAEALLAHPDFSRTRLHLHRGVGANSSWASRLYPADHRAVGTWGMTETGPMAVSSRHDDPLAVRTGAHGRPLPGVELRIVDPQSGAELPVGVEGELLVRGASLMARYYGMTPAECFDAQGFFHSGDLAAIDRQGLLHFIGRLKDVIKTAGVNVAAAEVEAVLQQHAKVQAAAVVGVPHPIRGENVAAFVVARDPSCTADDLLAYCRERLASYKVPRHIVFCTAADLPTLGSGKVDKRALRARAAALAG